MNGPATRTAGPTPISEIGPGTVVRVPFPYSDGATRQHRPALVIAAVEAPDAPPLLWVLMITSAENRPWAGDIELAPLHGTGLSAPSVVRTAKIATIDRGRAEARGTIAPAVLDAVRAAVRARLGL